MREINDVRNAIFHGKESRNFQSGGVSVWSVEGIEKFFIAAQLICMELPRFAEMIDSPRAQAEKWARRLRELGQPLY